MTAGDSRSSPGSSGGKNLSGRLRAARLCVAAALAIPGFCAAQGFEADIAGFEQADAANPAPPGAILFTGSSSIRGWSGLAADFPDYAVLNRGFGGSAMSDVLFYFDRYVVPPHPSLVVVYEGDNDIASGVGVAALVGEYGAFLDLMAQRLPESDVAFLAIKPSPSRVQWLAEYLAANAAIRELAESRGARFIDVASPMLDADGQPDPQWYVADMLHMNPSGYDLWQSIVSPALDDWKASRRLAFLVDFGSDDLPTSRAESPNDPVQVWNNVTESLGTTAGGRLEDLVSRDGEVSGIGLTIESPFAAGAALDGPDDAPGLPARATVDSLVGPASFRLTGLDPQRRYSLEFFASVPDGTDAGEFAITIQGADAQSLSLAPDGNREMVPTAEDVSPDESGTILVQLTPGTASSVRLGALRIRRRETALPAAIVSQPESQTVDEFEPATFLVGISGAPPLTVQWFRDGEAIPDATGIRYTLAESLRALDGSVFSAVASNGFSEAVSEGAALTVLPDESPPTPVSASSSDGRRIVVVFSEPVNPDSSAEWLVNGATDAVESAAFSDDRRSVTLTLREALTGAFAVAVSGLTDRAGNPVAPGSSVDGDIRSTFLLDFGGGDTTGSGDAPDNDPARAWNNVTAAVAASSTGRLAGLVSADGVASGIALAMIDRFNGVNSNGTTASSLFPANATRDSFYGNTALFSGLENVFPKFCLEGLNPDTRYTLTFYASRTGVSDRRWTEYTVEGTTTETARLDPANNIAETASVDAMAPASDGTIVVSLTPGPDNTNANRFTYLGVLQIDAFPAPIPEPPPPLVLTPSTDGTSIVLDWTGNAVLEWSPNLSTWSQSDPDAAPPIQFPLTESPARYFRLRPR